MAICFSAGAVAASLALSGCAGPRPLHGGRALTNGTVAQTLAQSDNPNQPSSQTQETIRTRTYLAPPSAHPFPSAPIGPMASYSSSPPLTLVDREETRATTVLGAAQKDTAREIGAKLSSLRGVTWLGVALFLFGAASLVWPPLKAVIGSVTTSLALIGGGLALLVLPTLIAGNELIILGGVGLGAGAWLLAHRHGQLRGQLSAAEPFHLSRRSSDRELQNQTQRNPEIAQTPPTLQEPSQELRTATTEQRNRSES